MSNDTAAIKVARTVDAGYDRHGLFESAAGLRATRISFNAER
jgi:hypothetical protein